MSDKKVTFYLDDLQIPELKKLKSVVRAAYKKLSRNEPFDFKGEKKALDFLDEAIKLKTKPKLKDIHLIE